MRLTTKGRFAVTAMLDLDPILSSTLDATIKGYPPQAPSMSMPCLCEISMTDRPLGASTTSLSTTSTRPTRAP